MISNGWVSPEFSWGDMRFLQLGGYDPSIQAINNPEIIIPLPQMTAQQAQPTTQNNCACLTGQPYIENGVCKCTDVLQSPIENKPIFTPQRKPREIIDFNYAPNATAGQGINPLFLIGGAIVLVLLLKN